MSRRERTGAGVTSLTHEKLNRADGLVSKGALFRAICNHCEVLSEGRYEQRDYTIGQTGVTLNTLVGACSGCNEIIIIPHQSSSDIKKALEENESK
ncbi:hypothetical protein BM527_04510 [Alteromonas sp. Mex14]|nr:hypothetical protein BM527_04510 [Alteromonas sp. Mex14]